MNRIQAQILVSLAVLSLVSLLTALGQVIPKVWNASEFASFELPLVQADASARHVSPDYYYRIPERSIYKSYPI
jgi:hypothetical protein